MKTILIITLLLLNCGYRCYQTESSAEAAAASSRGARVKRLDCGAWQYCGTEDETGKQR